MAEVSTAFVKQFGNTLLHLVQQKGSRLRRSVVIVPNVTGEEFSQDQLGTQTAKKKTTRNADTPITAPDHQRRWGTLFDYEVAQLHDKQDQLKMLLDPTSQYMQSQANALGRAQDDVIIAAASGTARADKTGSTDTSLGSGQKIAVAGDGLTIAKLISASEILNASDVDPDEPRYCVYSAKQLTNLLNTTQVTSADFNSVKALVEGKVNTFMGFIFIRSQRLETDGASSRLVLCYTQTAIALGVAQELTARVDERADKSYAKQTYASLGIGAVRLEEEKVVQVACSES